MCFLITFSHLKLTRLPGQKFYIILKNRYLKILFIFTLFVSSYQLTIARQREYNPNDTTRLVAFDSVVAKIEKIHHVKIYYNPEWFLNKKFRESVTQLSLESSIEVINRIANLSCITLNPTTYVFVPVEIRNYSNRMNSKGVLLIGEPNESGTNATIFGKIIDFRTGKPLDGARITIDKLKLNTITDREGNYKFTVPTGEYDLSLNYVGYDEDYRKIRVIGNGIVNFELAEKVIKLKELLVTDRADNMNIMRTQMSTVKMNAKMIKELPGFLGEKDVIKNVTLLPGIQSTGEFGTGFFVRGGSSDQNLILVEDVPLFNSAHLFGFSSAINSDAVTSVTLLKAGIPAKYGERASSVMDIRLENNADKLSGRGGIGLLNSRLNFEIPLFNNNVSLFVGGRTSYSNWLLHAMPDSELKNSSAGFYDINALLKIKLSPKDNLTLFGYYSNDEFSFTKNSPYEYNNTLASVRYSHVFNEKFYTTILAGYSRYRNDINSLDTLKPKEAYKINSFINYKNAKINFAWSPNENHAIEFGANAVHYQLQQGNLSPLGELSEVNPVTTTGQQAIEMSGYVSDDIKFTPKISAEIGLRFSEYASLGPGRSYVFTENAPRTIDNISDTLFYGNNEAIKWYSSVEPRLSFRYTLDKLSSLKLSYNRISQYINLVSNTAVMSPNDVYNLSSANIKPLVNNQIAVGYFHNSEDNAYESSVEIYYKKSDNIVEYRNGATILLNNALEADLLNASGYSYGLEFLVKKNTGKLTGWLSYTYSRAFRRTSSPFIEDQINRNNYYPSPYDIPNNLVINATYHLTRRWRASGVFYYNTGKPVTLPELKYDFNGRQYIYYSDRNKYRLPDYHRLDLSITFDESLKYKQKWKGSWTFSILNLYGQKNPYSVFYKSNSPLATKFYQKFNLYQMFIIERPIPTFTYNFSF